jgi:hypothetical protein
MLDEDGQTKDPTVFDKDGHMITASLTNDPSAQHLVDIFVELNVPPKDVALVLSKAAEWVEELMAPASLKELTAQLDDHEARRRSA